MNLKKKKKLIARTLGIGLERVKLDDDMKEEIKEAITRQDIKDLIRGKVIKIKEKKGRKKKRKRKTKRSVGTRKKKLRKRKQVYVKLTRKFRTYLKKLKKKGELNKEEYHDLRKKIKAKTFRDFSHLKDIIRRGK